MQNLLRSTLLSTLLASTLFASQPNTPTNLADLKTFPHVYTENEYKETELGSKRQRLMPIEEENAFLRDCIMNTPNIAGSSSGLMTPSGKA